MTAAFEQNSEAKQAAILRSLANIVASPAISGRKGNLDTKRQKRWQELTESVVLSIAENDLTLSPNRLAEIWKQDAKVRGIGAGLLGWFLWNWALQMLIELAKLWIESRRNQSGLDWD